MEKIMEKRIGIKDNSKLIIARKSNKIKNEEAQQKSIELLQRGINTIKINRAR